MKQLIVLAASLVIGQSALAYDPNLPEDTSHVALLQSAKSYMALSDYEEAIFSINNILLLAKNSSSEEAQYLLIDALIKSHKAEKAKIEAQYFLNTYPDSKFAQDAREKLIGLEISTMLPPAAGKHLERKPRVARTSQLDIATSSYYHGGDGQSLLALAAKVNAVEIVDNYTLKYVIRYSSLRNLANSKGNRYNLSQAWVSAENVLTQQEIKVGRLLPSTGAIGRFDGMLLKQTVADSTKLVVSAGIPYTPGSDKRQFASVGLEYYIGDYSLSSYGTVQKASIGIERAAVGTEARYFLDGTSALLAGEFDVLFRSFNYLTSQVTKKLEDFDVYTLYDRRKSPMLFLNRDTPLLSKSEQVDYVINSTATAQTAVLGISKRIADINTYADIQYTNISSLSPVYDKPAVSGTSSTSLNLQLSFKNKLAILTSLAPKQRYIAFVKDYLCYSANCSTIARLDNANGLNHYTLSTKVVKVLSNTASLEAQLSLTTGLRKSFYIGLNNDL